MKYIIIGHLFENNIELSCDFTCWLIGFGWIRHNQYRYVQRISIHINLGPFAIMITIL